MGIVFNDHENCTDGIINSAPDLEETRSFPYGLRQSSCCDNNNCLNQSVECQRFINKESNNCTKSDKRHLWHLVLTYVQVAVCPSSQIHADQSKFFFVLQISLSFHFLFWVCAVQQPRLAHTHLYTCPWLKKISCLDFDCRHTFQCQWSLVRKY